MNGMAGVAERWRTREAGIMQHRTIEWAGEGIEVSAAKRLWDLTEEDLRCNPIWRYEGESDAVALVVPTLGFAEPDHQAYIARTRFVLADGSEWWGYCSPTDDSGLDYMQPVIVTQAGLVRFWHEGLVPESETAHACRLLGRTPEQVFPVRFECVVPFDGRLVAGLLSRIEGTR
jgi:hypothetical protein